MAATPSTMVKLGSIAPDFYLPDVVSGNKLSLQELKGNVATVIMFICNHCPYVKHVNAELIKLAKDYGYRGGVNFIAISSNDASQYSEDGPEKMKEAARQLGYTFPYLYDETQEVAKSYDAACTPDFFIYDRLLRLVYRGQLDDSRPGSEIPVTGKDIRDALRALVEGRSVSDSQKPSVGCSIKWKK